MNRLPKLILTALAFLALASCRSSGNFGTEQEQLADKARASFVSMMKDNQYPGLVDLATRAKAVIIVPNMYRAAFFFGGNGGYAVMLAHSRQGWSDPAFYTIGGLSWGLQFGGQDSELIITVMTDKGMRAVINRKATLGADAGVAVGELGEGLNAATGMDTKADMYAFARSAGLFVGISLDGSVIAPRQSWNEQLYGKGATPESILIDRTSTSTSQAVTGLVAAMP